MISWNIPRYKSSRSLKEKCGIFGIYLPKSQAARLTLPALWALQHRGQESSGITTSDGKQLYTHKGMGLVASVYNEGAIRQLPGHMAVGHNRYSTSQESTLEHAQPVLKNGASIALVHNGNLPSTQMLETFLSEKRVKTANSNDSEMMTDAIDYFMNRGAQLEEAIVESYNLFTGVFSLLTITKDKLIASRDPCGIRPLSIGTLNGGYVFSSETCALDTIGACFLRDVNPGEMVVVDGNGLSSFQVVKSQPKLDIFEFVYFARPDSTLLGKSVYEVRKNLGINLALEHPTQADLVMPVPDSAIPAALGFSQQSKIPFEPGLTKNQYIHRTFIQPDERQRKETVQMKLNPIEKVIRGKSIVLVDDSIVRGTTAGFIVKLLRKAGAKAVHLMISSPPVKYPDFYGIDTPSQKELIAATVTLDDIREKIGADSLHYLSYEGLIGATGLPEEVFSTSCFTGVYPIDIGERAREIERFVYP